MDAGAMDARDVLLADALLPTPPPSETSGSSPPEPGGPTGAYEAGVGYRTAFDGTDHDQAEASSQRIVSVSTTFYPGSALDPLPIDVILLSIDSVFFNVHTHRLLSASNNGFAGLLPRSSGSSSSDVPEVVAVPEQSAVLNLVLHAAYGISCVQYAPPFELLADSVRACKLYGLEPSRVFTPGAPLCEVLMSHTPLRPMDVYILAAQNKLNDLAVLASAHLVSFPLSTITDEMAEAIGPIYLKKLFFLHLGRADALKRLLLAPPAAHAPIPKCGYEERTKLTRAWALTAAYLAWDARPDVLPSTMEAAVRPLAQGLKCDLCRAALEERMKGLILQWTLVKGTI